MTTNTFLKNVLVFFGPILLCIQVNAATRTVIGTGNWSNVAIWDGGIIPGSDDDVSMNDGTGVTVQNGQTLTVKSFTCVKNNSLTIETGGSLTVTGVSAGKNTTITVNGTLTINGNLAAVQELMIIVNGTLNINGNLSMTNMGNITVNSGGNMNLTGNLSAMNNLSLTVNGNLDVDGNVSANNDFDLNVGGDLDIGGNLSGQNNMTANIDGNIDVSGNWSGGNTFILTVNGTGTVGGNLSAGNNSVASGSGHLAVSGSISGPPAFTGASILPVTLLYFKATKAMDGVLLTWATAAEINNDFFRLEKSTDGIHFNELAIIKGAGNSLELLTYQFLDKYPFSTTYYRLSQTDFDGTTTYFDVVQTSFGQRDEVRIFPTIIPDGVFHVSINEQSKARNLKVVSMEGKTVFQTNVQPGVEQLYLHKQLNPGMYLVVVADLNGVVISTQKVFLE